MAAEDALPNPLQFVLQGKRVTYHLVTSGPPPVYGMEPSGEHAYPTGRVFLVVREGTRLREVEPAIVAAGFQVAERPRYAPEAAWVEATEGGIAFALNHFETLAALDGVESAAPQMESRAERR